MTKQEEMFRRFDERFVVESSYPGVTCLNTENPGAIKSFLQSEIDLALAEREKELVEIIKENISDNFEISYSSDIDITELPPELIAEANGAKKAMIGTRDLILSLITKPNENNPKQKV